LQNFHPKPGRLVSPAETHYIVPDIFVVEVAGEFVVQVNDDGVPRLRISQMYQNLLNANTAKNDPTREFVQDKLRAAMWLIKSIQNRQQTIYKTAKAIVRQQQEFFKKGPRYLKPMILKDVAEEDRKSTRLNSSHVKISYAVFCLKKKTKKNKLYV